MTSPRQGFDLSVRFTLGAFLRDRVIVLVLGIASIAAVVLIAKVQGVSAAGCIMLAVVPALALGAGLAIAYGRRRWFYQELSNVMDQVETASFVPSMLDEPHFLEGRLTAAALQSMAVLADRETVFYKSEQENHRRFIELWIHEVKTPLASLRLIASKMHGSQADALRHELERAQAAVERALYYARASSSTIDYELRQVPLEQVVREALKKNANLLLERGVAPTIQIPADLRVIIDEPWLVFMLCQVVANSAKYDATRLVFSAWEEEGDTPRGRTVLEVRDDGCGIPAKDVPRVFERGFVGENGRQGANATGMGLFFVALLARKLGISVELTSAENQGTAVIFAFPHDRRVLGRQAQSV